MVSSGHIVFYYKYSNKVQEFASKQNGLLIHIIEEYFYIGFTLKKNSLISFTLSYTVFKHEPLPA